MRLTSMKKRLGDILVDVGIITPGQLEEALDTQRNCGEKLGAILARMGVINEEVMLAFLGKQCGVSYVSLAEYGDIPPEVLRSVPETVVRRQNLLPIAVDGNTITVAMSDPFNVFAVDDIKLMTGREVQVVIASEQEIRSAISRYYAHQPSMEKDIMRSGTGGVSAEDEAARAFLKQALDAKASMIFLDPQPAAVRVRFRIDGHIQERAFLSRELAAMVTKKLLTYASQRDDAPLPFDGKFQVQIGGSSRSFRLSVVPAAQGERVVLHTDEAIAQPRELDKLGLNHEALFLYKKAISRPSGLVLITGPARCGKTLTLYSALSAINFSDRDIVSLEDTVECVLPGIGQVARPNDRQPGESLRMLLAQDPDVIGIDIGFDRETAQAAFSAAIGGKLVIATMNANDGIEAVTRVLNMGVDPFTVASSLTVVLNQRLVRGVCPSCKETYEIAASILKGTSEIAAGALKSTSAEPSGQAQDTKLSLWRGKGCASCGMTGYMGRNGVFELIHIDDALRSLISERSSESHLRETCALRGVVTLREAALQKVLSGATTIEEFMRVTGR